MPPYHRWAFQNVQQVTRTTRVPRAPEPTPLGAAPQDLGGVTFEDTQGRETTFEEMLARTYTDGILVLHEGRVVAERYENGMRPDTLHLLMSWQQVADVHARGHRGG